MRDYRAVADAVAAEIASGKLAPACACRRSAASPMNRGSRCRRQAASMRTGAPRPRHRRGRPRTFVRAPETLRAARNGEVTETAVDLLVAMSMSLEQAALLAPALKPLSDRPALYGALDALGPFGPKGAGETVAGFLGHKRWTPEPSDILFAGGAGRRLPPRSRRSATGRSHRGRTADLSGDHAPGVASRRRSRSIDIDARDRHLGAGEGSPRQAARGALHPAVGA